MSRADVISRLRIGAAQAPDEAAAWLEERIKEKEVLLNEYAGQGQTENTTQTKDNAHD